jgi:hypothetical protein
VRIIPVRVALRDAASLAKGVAFAVSTPARIVLTAFDEQSRGELAVMTAAAKRFETVLFIASLPELTADETKTGEAVANLVLLDSKERAHAAAEAVAQVLGCARGDLAGASGADLERAFLDRLGEKSPQTCEPKPGEQSK